jgi:hypothetical protein
MENGEFLLGDKLYYLKVWKKNSFVLRILKYIYIYIVCVCVCVFSFTWGGLENRAVEKVGIVSHEP